MNRALERCPLSVARRGLYRSGQRLDPLVGSATMDGDSQVVSWERDKRILSRLSRQGSSGTCTTMLAGPACGGASTARLHSRTNWTPSGPAGLRES
jgi:hypothetical protein